MGEEMEIEPVQPAPVAAAADSTGRSDGGGKAEHMWIEKYRPQGLGDLLSHQNIIATLTRLIRAKKLPHLLFYGPPGTGKTSTILACAREMYGKSFSSMVLSLNASDDRGIDVVREQIKNFASTKRIFSSGIKLIVLDEADAMTNAAQMALRRVIEKYAQNARFCIICNYANKIIPAIQSRCTKFRFAPLAPDDIQIRLQEIAQAEGVNVSDDGITALIKLGKGDMRRSLNILQSSSMAVAASENPNAQVDKVAIYSNTGSPLPEDIARIVSWLLNDDFAACVEQIREVKSAKGLALDDIVREVHDVLLTMDMPPKPKGYALRQLADVEYRLASGCSEKLNTLALIGAMKFTVGMTIAEAK